MASTYSPNLRLELIGTGEQQGTWGIITNTNLGTLLEEAIGGYISVAVTDGADTTLTTNNGSADQSRNMVINLTGALTASRNVICPAIEKMYVVKNATTGGQAVTFKVSGQTGVSIPNGSTYILYVNGTDAALASGTIAAQNSNNVSITGGSLSGITSITVAAGSNTAPSITTTGDTNTGIYFPAADTIATTTGGAERMRIDANGNVGIGTTSPGSSRLFVSSASSVLATLETTAASSDNVQLRFKGTSGDRWAIGNNVGTGGAGLNFEIYDLANSLTRFTINSSGNVGIGTTSPSTFGKLAVTGSATKTIGVSVASAGSTASPAETNLISAWTSGGLYQAGIFSVNTFTSDFGNALTFKTTDTAGTTAERMRIDASGNVGIGVSPSVRLDVASGSAQLAANFNSTNASGVYVRFQNSGTAIGDLGSGGNLFAGGTAGDFGLTSRSGNLVFGTSSTERMRIDSSGNVGIGVTPSAWGAVYPGRIQGVGWAIATPLDGGTDTSAFATNAYNSSGGTWNYRNTAAASLYQQFTATHRWYTAPSGTAGNAITFTERMRIDSSGNVGIGTSTFGTSAATVLAIATGTAPSTGPADTIQIFSTDLSAGNTILSLRTEGTPVNANTTAAATHRIAVRINGTVYYLLANTAA